MPNSKLQNAANLWLVRLSELENQKDKFADFLDENETMRLKQFSNDQAAKMFLFSRGILRYLIGIYLNCKPKSIVFSLGQHGKPYLADKRNFYFNLSHSRGVIAVLFSRHEAGVDIEWLDRKIEFKAIMKRYFTKNEILSWKKHCVPDEKTAFLRGWTRKEAFLKATGEGISGLSKCEISFEPDIFNALISRNNTKNELNIWSFFDFKIGESHIGTCVIKCQRPNVSIYNFTEEWQNKLLRFT